MRVWGYRVTGVMKQEKYPVAQFKTENLLWRHLEPAIMLLNQGAETPVPHLYRTGTRHEALSPSSAFQRASVRKRTPYLS